MATTTGLDEEGGNKSKEEKFNFKRQLSHNKETMPEP
jgi:hypothetical protein